MKLPKTAYELSESQVGTPPKIVSQYWEIISSYRKNLNHVLDMGAGDARFAKGGLFQKYDGVEIDSKKIKPAENSKNIKIINGCVFKHSKKNYDACIGNPPYVRHHDIEANWKTSTTKSLGDELNIKLDLHCNLYLYFMCLGLIKTHAQGLVALVIPFEWVSRPSAKPIREYLQLKKWNVSVYEFEETIFPGVLTTASISVIDKSKTTGKWSFFSIDSKLRVNPRVGINESGQNILPYSNRGEVWARRGLSPGTQRVFTLTDEERKKANLKRSDVQPCVTTMKNIPRSISVLDTKTFRKYFVKAGQRCWLIKSTDKTLSSQLKKYLNSVPAETRDTYTCLNNDPWYSYEKFNIPKFLFHSGFVKEGPKILVNEIGAQAVGSVYGIDSKRKVLELHKEDLMEFLLKFDFESKIVPHANSLKKIEVKQLNNVLAEWLLTRCSNAGN